MNPTNPSGIVCAEYRGIFFFLYFFSSPFIFFLFPSFFDSCLPLLEAFWGNIFHSPDGGHHWRQINESNLQKYPDVPWWPYGFFTSATSTISFDPHFPGKVYYTDWFGIWVNYRFSLSFLLFSHSLGFLSLFFSVFAFRSFSFSSTVILSFFFYLVNSEYLRTNHAMVYARIRTRRNICYYPTYYLRRQIIEWSC